ncbi:MAG: hypothetical protein MHM6MM_002983 [Cercozoa sp. M6MM]
MSAPYITCGVFGFLVIVASLTLFGLSFSRVGTHELGIKYNTVSQNIGSDVKGSGRYFSGVGQHYVVYPTNEQLVEFASSGETPNPDDTTSFSDTKSRGSLTAWSKDGQNVYLDVSFTYALTPSKLRHLYLTFGDPDERYYHEVFADMSQEAMKESTTTFLSTEFFTRRTEITRDMAIRVKEVLSVHGAVLKSFQMRKVQFEPAFDAKVTDKVIVGVLQSASREKRTAQVLRAQATLVLKQGEADALVVASEAQKNATVIVAAASAERLLNVTSQKQVGRVPHLLLLFWHLCFAGVV